MPLPVSAMLASKGLEPPAGDVAGGAGGFSPQNMMAFMQAFGGLKQPQAPAQDIIRPPGAVAPLQANANALANTGNTAALAAMLSAGRSPTIAPSLGSLIVPKKTLV